MLILLMLLSQLTTLIKTHSVLPFDCSAQHKILHSRRHLRCGSLVPTTATATATTTAINAHTHTHAGSYTSAICDVPLVPQINYHATSTTSTTHAAELEGALHCVLQW